VSGIAYVFIWLFHIKVKRVNYRARSECFNWLYSYQCATAD